ncbi:MAG: DUF6340 family protein [Myxococcota bacterium]
MRAWLLFVTVVISVSSGCASTINLEVLRPAALAVPREVQTIAVVDRSKAKNFGQGLLGAIEGALTGEEIGADTEGRASARQGLAQSLALSPRFNVVTPSLTPRGADSSLFDTADLSWRQARRICQRSNCEGIVTLEAFDSDKVDDVQVGERTETVDGKERTVRTFEVERRLSVLTSWRLYDVPNQQVLDDLRETSFSRSWTSSGDTREAAFAGLPSQTQMVSNVAFEAGRAYGQRIAPSYVWVSRRYFGRGDPTFKEARSRVRGLDWDGAAKLWRRLRKSDDPKLRGKAFFNLALFHEVNGRLDMAMQQAQRANRLLDRGLTRRYVSTLAYRKAEEARLDEQL